MNLNIIFSLKQKRGVGYSKDFDNGNPFNFYVSIPEFDSIFDLRKISFGFDLSINGYDVGIGFGPERSIAIHLKEYSLDIYQDALKRSGIKFSSKDVDGTYSYSKFEINGLETSMVIPLIKYGLGYLGYLLQEKLENAIVD